MSPPLLIGAIFLFVGIKILIVQLKLRSQPSTIIPGKVIGYEKRKSRKKSKISLYGRYSYAPIFEYFYNNEIKQVAHTLSTNNENWLENNFSVGQPVELLVYENNPDDAVLNTKFGINIQIIMATIFSIIGIIALGIHIFIII